MPSLINCWLMSQLTQKTFAIFPAAFRVIHPSFRGLLSFLSVIPWFSGDLRRVPGRRFSLLWRVSRDGFKVSEFHRRCDGHPNTLVVSLGWNGNRGCGTGSTETITTVKMRCEGRSRYSFSNFMGSLRKRNLTEFRRNEITRQFLTPRHHTLLTMGTSHFVSLLRPSEIPKISKPLVWKLRIRWHRTNSAVLNPVRKWLVLDLEWSFSNDHEPMPCLSSRWKKTKIGHKVLAHSRMRSREVRWFHRSPTMTVSAQFRCKMSIMLFESVSQQVVHNHTPPSWDFHLDLLLRLFRFWETARSGHPRPWNPNSLAGLHGRCWFV
jgi:hypothetical protein